MDVFIIKYRSDMGELIEIKGKIFSFNEFQYNIQLNGDPKNIVSIRKSSVISIKPMVK